MDDALEGGIVSHCSCMEIVRHVETVEIFSGQGASPFDIFERVFLSQNS